MKPRWRQSLSARVTVAREVPARLASSSWDNGSAISIAPCSPWPNRPASSTRSRASRCAPTVTARRRSSMSVSAQRRVIMRRNVRSAARLVSRNLVNASKPMSKASTTVMALIVALRRPVVSAEVSPTTSPSPRSATTVSWPSSVTERTFTQPSTSTNTCVAGSPWTHTVPPGRYFLVEPRSDRTRRSSGVSSGQNAWPDPVSCMVGSPSGCLTSRPAGTSRPRINDEPSRGALTTCRSHLPAPGPPRPPSQAEEEECGPYQEAGGGDVGPGVRPVAAPPREAGRTHQEVRADPGPFLGIGPHRWERQPGGPGVNRSSGSPAELTQGIEYRPVRHGQQEHRPQPAREQYAEQGEVDDAERPAPQRVSRERRLQRQADRDRRQRPRADGQVDARVAQQGRQLADDPQGLSPLGQRPVRHRLIPDGIVVVVVVPISRS